MNKHGFSFLFFFVSLTSLSGFVRYLSYPQEVNDSSLYYHKIIVNLENSTALHSAFLFFERETEKSLAQGDTIAAVQHLRRIAIGQFQLGFLNESEATAVRGIHLLEQLGTNKITKASKRGLANHLGLVYRKLNLLEKALRFYEEALELASGTMDSVVIINNISNIYLDQKKYELAIKNLSLVYEKSRDQSDSLRIAMALSNLGFAQSKVGMPESLNNMQNSLMIRQRNNDIPGTYSSHQHLSKYYSDNGNRQKSIEHAEQAYKLAKQLNSASYLENALSLLLDLSEDPRVLEYRKLTDSIASAMQIQENKYAAFKYDVEQERQKTQEAELKNEKQKSYKIIFLSAFFIAVVSTIFIVYRKNQQRKTELVQTAQKTEARISKRVHDDLANDVSGVMTFVESKLNIPTKVREKLLNFLSDIYTRARDISVENAEIDVSDFPKALKNLMVQHHPVGVNIITAPYSNINWVAVPEHKKKAVFKSLQELLVNTKKHAKATLVTIAFHKKGRKNEIVYADDGSGFNSNTIVFGGLGNVETRMTEIGGSFSFESSEGKGFKASLTF
ncbi:MAG: tetratricopeptide repeat protein [Bacteroidota bacterium]